jgi:hypothetical protein
MPKRVEQKLKARARRLHLRGERWRRYVYGGLRRTGWRPPRERR